MLLKGLCKLGCLPKRSTDDELYNPKNEPLDSVGEYFVNVVTIYVVINIALCQRELF